MTLSNIYIELFAKIVRGFNHTYIERKLDSEEFLEIKSWLLLTFLRRVYTID